MKLNHKNKFTRNQKENKMHRRGWGGGHDLPLLLSGDLPVVENVVWSKGGPVLLVSVKLDAICQR